MSEYHKHVCGLLYKPYQKAVKQITGEYFTENKPMLTEREMEIAKLAADGFSTWK
jgi:DNA-binding NarL/FixJ family response regulator